MDVREGWLSVGAFAVFDGRTLEIFGDQVYEGEVGSTIRLHVAQIADLDLRPAAGGPKNAPPSLTWIRRDGKAFPLSLVDADCTAFAEQLIESVRRSRSS